MLTYLILETRPDVNGSWLAVGGGINKMCHFLDVDIASTVILLLIITWLDEVSEPWWGVGFPGGGFNVTDDITDI